MWQAPPPSHRARTTPVPCRTFPLPGGASASPALPSSAARCRAALGATGRPPCAPPSRPCGPSRRASSPRAPGFLSRPDSLSCPGGRPRGLGISSLFKPGYFQCEVMDGVLDDRDDLGVDLCLGRRLGPLLRNARAQRVLSQNIQATNETMAWLASCEVISTINERAARRKRHGPAVVITQ